MGNIVYASGLTDKERQSIRMLEETCSEHEKLSMKLNWDMLDKRAGDEINDFLYYDDDLLIGFVGLYGFGQKPTEIEITGMVHPEYRNKGVFKKLFDEARRVCEERGTGKILLISERSSVAGINFVKSVGAQYSFSEYRMKFEGEKVPDFKDHGISLHKAEHKDLPQLIEIDKACFGSSEEEAKNYYTDSTFDSIHMAKLEDTTIGRIGVLSEGKAKYIFGFGIMPEYRGLGYGRAVLSLALSHILLEGIQPVFLEVAANNDNALMLYKSCGFKEITVYDYYEIVLFN